MMQTHPISAHHPQISSIIWILYVTAVKIVNSYWGRRTSHQRMLGSREPLYFERLSNPGALPEVRLADRRCHIVFETFISISTKRYQL